jgi:predicted small secreted protein
MTMMKILTMAAVAATALTVSACETHTGTGAAVGALGGAAAGVLTGGSAVTGAVIGSAGGAIVGGAVDRDVNSGKCFQRGVEVACPPQ